METETEANLLMKLTTQENVVKSMQVELDDLQATLAEEQWLVQAQKQEIDRLRSELDGASKVAIAADEKRQAAEGKLASLHSEYETSKGKWIEDLRALANERRTWEHERKVLLQRLEQLEKSSPKIPNKPHDDLANGDTRTISSSADTVSRSESTTDGDTPQSGDDTIEEKKDEGSVVVSDAWDNLKAVQEEKDMLAAKIEKLKDAHEREIEAFKADHEALTKQVEALRGDTDVHLGQITQLSHQCETLTRGLGAMKLERDNLLEVQKSLEQKFRAVNAELVESKSTCTVLQANVQAAEDKMGLQDELNIELNAKVNALSKRLADKGAELDEREAEWQQLKHDFEKRYSELQDLRKRAEEQLEATLTQVKDAGDEAAQLMVELREVRTRADDFAGRWSESCVELSRVEAENNALNVTHDAMKQEVQEMRVRFNLMRAEVEEREAESVSLKTQVARLLEELDSAQLVNSEMCEKLKELHVRKSIQTPSRHWQADSAANACNDCDAAFSLTNRRHHCRMCGLIFCDTCTANRIHIGASKHLVRVCRPCYDSLSQPGVLTTS